MRSGMSSFTEHHFLGLSPAGFHRVRYLEWGANDGRPTVLCVHGLTRNAHDFDFLAERLARRYRVIAVDVVGRGGSAWLTDPAHYTYAQYQADMTALIARLEVERVHWIGTSMGGLIGMFLAAMPKTPLASLFMNDVGPVIPQDSAAADRGLCRAREPLFLAGGVRAQHAQGARAVRPADRRAMGASGSPRTSPLAGRELWPRLRSGASRRT